MSIHDFPISGAPSPTPDTAVQSPLAARPGANTARPAGFLFPDLVSRREAAALIFGVAVAGAAASSPLVLLIIVVLDHFGARP